MSYKNTKVKVCSTDGDTNFFNIIPLAACLFITCRIYVLRTLIDLMKENGFTLEKVEADDTSPNITDTNYADDIAFLANTPTEPEFLLHSLERAADGIGFHVDADKTEFMCFNLRCDISTLNGGSPKLLNRFTYLGISVSSTQKMTSIRD